jgi:hypothetical protein
MYGATLTTAMRDRGRPRCGPGPGTGEGEGEGEGAEMIISAPWAKGRATPLAVPSVVLDAHPHHQTKRRELHCCHSNRAQRNASD